VGWDRCGLELRFVHQRRAFHTSHSPGSERREDFVGAGVDCPPSASSHSQILHLPSSPAAQSSTTVIGVASVSFRNAVDENPGSVRRHVVLMVGAFEERDFEKSGGNP